MVRWPRTITPAVSDYSWAFWDVMPTLAELTGATSAVGINGESIVPTLMGQSQQVKEYLFWTLSGTGCAGNSCRGGGPDIGVEWVREQSRAGTLVYHDTVTHAVQSNHPTTGEVGKPHGASGYGMRSGDWKIVVAHCASNDKPSRADVAEVYNIRADPFEFHNLNATSAGKQQIATFLAIAKSHIVTCNCFQC